MILTAAEIEDIKRKAHEEFKEELTRAYIDRYKEKLRNRRSLWDRLFPWKIIIIRKNNV